MHDPIHDFLKYAGRVAVKAYVRTEQDGDKVPVKGYTRKQDAAQKKSPVPAASAVPAVPAGSQGSGDEDTAAAAAAAAALTAKKDREVLLWRAWKDSGPTPKERSPKALQPLLKSFRPMINSRVSTYRGKLKMVPDSTIEAEFNLRFVDALESYDPSKGSLGTYVYRYLDKAKRFIVENQNIGRIPENRAYKIKLFTTTRDDLTDELERAPTEKELGHRLGWSVAEVDRMDSELRNDLVSQGFEEDPYSFTPSKSEETIRLFKYELAGEEREVYEYLTGLGRPQVTSTGDIAKLMKVPDYKVSRIKQTIQTKLKRYIND
jgi:DNA-directed RNA polymerase specialized sigma subunit